MKYITKALLAYGLLLHAASVFLPWFESSILGGNFITYWSFKARIYPYPYPQSRPPYEEMYFHSSWFVSQILTLLLGFLTLLKEVKGKYSSVFLGLTLLFSAMPIGTCILTAYTAGTRTLFLPGFWIAIFAFLLLIASLSTSLIKKKCGLKSKAIDNKD